jgi:hypothetical protein
MANGMELNMANILGLFSFILPVLLAFFLVMLSLFNQDIKGLIYLAGVLMTSAINYIVMNTIKSNIDAEKTSLVCNIIEFPGNTAYNSPSASSVFIAFTIAYLFLPMKYNNNMNYMVLIFLLCLFGLDGYFKVYNYCTDVIGVSLEEINCPFLYT